MNKQRRADLLLVMTTFFWGASYYLTDICLADLPPMTLNAFRFIVAFLVLGLIFWKHVVHINRTTLRYSLIVGLALAGTYVAYNYGITRTSLSNAAFICALQVIFAPLLGFLFFRQRPGWKLGVALVVGTVGMALLTLNGELRPASGDLICLITPLCYAVDLLITEKAVRDPRVDPLGLGVCQLAVVGIVTLALALVLGEPVHLPGSEYRVTQAIAALADHDEYRHAIERRAAKFAYRYPRLLLGALIAGFVVPAALIIVFALTTSEKIVVMGTWLAWVLIIMGFLMVVEFMRDSIRRQPSSAASPTSRSAPCCTGIRPSVATPPPNATKKRTRAPLLPQSSPLFRRPRKAGTHDEHHVETVYRRHQTPDQQRGLHHHRDRLGDDSRPVHLVQRGRMLGPVLEYEEPEIRGGECG